MGLKSGKPSKTRRPRLSLLAPFGTSLESATCSTLLSYGTNSQAPSTRYAFKIVELVQRRRLYSGNVSMPQHVCIGIQNSMISWTLQWLLTFFSSAADPFFPPSSFLSALGLGLGFSFSAAFEALPRAGASDPEAALAFPDPSLSTFVCLEAGFLCTKEGQLATPLKTSGRRNKLRDRPRICLDNFDTCMQLQASRLLCALIFCVFLLLRGLPFGRHCHKCLLCSLTLKSASYSYVDLVSVSSESCRRSIPVSCQCVTHQTVQIQMCEAHLKYARCRFLQCSPIHSVSASLPHGNQ